MNKSLQVLKRDTIELSFLSAKIEGFAKPYSAAFLLAESEIHREDNLILFNLLDAYNYVSNNCNRLPEVEDIVVLGWIINKSIKKGCDKIRTCNVKISDTDYKPPLPNVKTLEEMVGELTIQKDTDKILFKSLEILKYQPLLDGNKRLFSLLVNWILAYNDLGILYLRGLRSEFFKNILNFYRGDNINVVISYFKGKVIYEAQ